MANQNPVAVFHMQNGGTMSVELYPEKAPISVANFVDLVQRGFYNNLIFHRVVEGFVIQAGSRSGTCAGEDLGFTIKGEFASNQWPDNDIPHLRGTISMARTMVPNSASTQFFICHQSAASLDGQYAAFGQLIDGFDTLDAIATTPTRSASEENRPLEPQLIDKVTMELNGYECHAPERIGNIKLS